MIGKVFKLALLAGAGVAAWKAATRNAPGSFFEQALHSGVAEVEAAKSAELRGASAELRRFAQELEHDHNEFNQKLAEAGGLEVPQPDAGQLAMLRQLDAHQGEEYDRAWLRHMARSHAKAIRLYQHTVDQAGAGAQVASQALPRLRAHARRVEELQQEGAPRVAGQAAPQASL